MTTAKDEVQTPFNRFLNEVEDLCETSEHELLGILQLLRIHWTLAGIAEVFRRINLLFQEFPEVFAQTDNHGWSEELPTQGRLKTFTGQVATMPSSQYGLGSLRSGEYPLMPVTGHSGIADVVLVDMFSKSADYRYVCAVFIELVVRYQACVQSSKFYKDYLVGGAHSTLLRREGGRIYAVSRLIKELAVRPDLAAWRSLPVIATPDKAWEVRLRHVAASHKSTQARVEGAVRGLAKHLQQNVAQVQESLDPWKPIASLDWEKLITISWGFSRAKGRRSNFAIRGEVRRRRIKRGGLTIEHSDIRGSSVHSGQSLDFFSDDDESARRHGPKRSLKKSGTISEEDDDWDEADDDLPHSDPVFSLFWSNGKSPVSTYYAHRSKQFHTERSHLLLPHLIDRPLRSQIATFIGQAVLAEYSGRARATLAGVLEMITGRPFNECLRVHIVEGSGYLHTPRAAVKRASVGKDGKAAPLPKRDQEKGKRKRRSLVLNSRTGVLLLRTASPDNKVVRPELIRGVLQPPGYAVRLQLPRWIIELAAKASREPFTHGPGYARNAKEELAKTLGRCGLTVAGLGLAMLYELLAVSGDDLGLAKVITGSAMVNMDNVIHYAAYRRSQVEVLWARAVYQLTGMAVSLVPARGDKWVGARISMDVERVRSIIAPVRGYVASGVEADDIVRFHNQFTTYVAYWVQLATASRKTNHPIPIAIDADGWALVADKARRDGSTHRLIPITPALMRQIQIYLNWADVISMLFPGLKASNKDAHRTAFPLRFIESRDGVAKVVPYTTKRARRCVHDISEHPDANAQLPGNWARKLVRSHSPKLAARYRDMGLGHWVAARHPFDWYSSVSVPKFREAWLQTQNELESALGFNLVQPDVPELRARSDLPIVAGWTGTEESAASRSVPKLLSEEEIQRCLENADSELANEVRDGGRSIITEAAVLLVRKSLTKSVLGRNPTYHDAKAISDFVRAKTPHKIYASRPGERNRRIWLTSQQDFVDWCHVQRDVLPFVESDLTRLSCDWTKNAAKAELGFLLMLLTLYLGVANWDALKSTLRTMLKKESISGGGRLRVLEVQVRNARSKGTMRRTVLLPPWFVAYFVSLDASVLAHLEHVLSPPSAKSPAATDKGKAINGHQTIRRSLDVAVREYLRSRGAQNVAVWTIARIMAAARQRILLRTTPLQAAYAAGQLETEDVHPNELRRFEGLARLNEQAEASTVALDSDPRGDDLKGDFRRDRHDVPEFAKKLVDTVRKRSINTIENGKTLERKSSDPAEVVLAQFVQWLGGHTTKERKVPAIYSSKQIRDIRRMLEIVCAGFLGMSGRGHEHWNLTGDDLQQMAELTALHYQERYVHGAWARFKTFLQSRNEWPAGMSVDLQSIEPLFHRHISAKILLQSEIQRVANNLTSIRSFIANPRTRKVARRHLLMTSQGGARRTEFERIRTEDLVDSRLLIRDFDGHSLKTESSNRRLPIGLFDEEMARHFELAVTKNFSQLIDDREGMPERGANFFAGLAKELKRGTTDADMGIHHLRHTLASVLTLSLAMAPLGGERLRSLFPWVEELVVDTRRLASLVHAEDGASVFRAISLALGHLHPSTTTRHYVHTLCVSQLAYVLDVSRTVEIHRFLEERATSRSAVRRMWGQAGPSDIKDDSIVRQFEMLRAWERKLGKTKAPPAGLLRLKIDDTPRGQEGAQQDSPEHNTDEGSTPLGEVGRPHVPGAFRSFAFETFESWENELREGRTGNDELIRVERALNRLATIPSGKPGVDMGRHRLQLIDIGAYVPEPLLPGLAVSNAAKVLEWLAHVYDTSRSAFEYLIDLWMYHSTTSDGTLAVSGSKEKFLDLPHRFDVKVKTIRRKGQPERGQIYVVGPDGKTSSKRSSSAVRWAMTWATVWYLMSKNDFTSKG